MPGHPGHVNGLKLPGEQCRGAEHVPQAVPGPPARAGTVAPSGRQVGGLKNPAAEVGRPPVLPGWRREDQPERVGSGLLLVQLEATGLLDGAVGTVRTPSGGLHLYFTGSEQRTGHLAACHIDFLAKGGYVLAPPSQIDGTPYQHVTALAQHGELDWRAAVRVLQPAREHAPQQPRQAQGEQIGRLAGWVAAQREGNRNNGLFWAANRALETDRAADLSPLAAAARQAGLTEPEITRTLESARRATQAHPEPRGREAEGAS